MIGSVAENLRILARQYSGQEIYNEDGTYTQAADILLYAADHIIELQKSLNDCWNELCQKCGEYKQQHNGACDGCRWKDW